MYPPIDDEYDMINHPSDISDNSNNFYFNRKYSDNKINTSD